MQKIEAPDAQPLAQEKRKTAALQTQTASLQNLYEQFHTSDKGLTSQEAQRRRDKAGANEPHGAQHSTGIVQFLRLFLNPLVIILLMASAVSAFLGDVVNASIIVTIVLLSILFNFFQ